jgi:glycosyltransferase involved in cell wall biosynthesis
MKKKILFIVQLPPPVHGTSLMNQYVVQSRLIQSEFECAVLPMQFSDNITDIGTASFKKLWRLLVFCTRLVGKLIAFRPHVVYFTMAPVGKAFYRDALFSCLMRPFRCKRLFHLHGKGIAGEAAASSFKRLLYKFVFSNSHLILLANSLKQDVSTVYAGNPFILHNGIPDRPTPLERTHNSMPVFLYLSNLVSSKGIHIFLKSIVNLHKKKIPFRAIITGAPYDISIEQVKKFIVEHNLGPNTIVTGPLYGKEKEAVLLEANILVFPTYYQNEAFPLTILEAMQAGLAVVTTSNGAISEIIENGVTGFITPMQDTAATTEKMELLAINATVRKEMGLKAIESVKQRYTMNIFERRLYDIFKQVLN